MKVVLVTGGFDPVHSGHIQYFQEARALGDKLIVGLNSDEWLTRKKGRPFMPLNERVAVVGNIKGVDGVITYDDGDGSSCAAIQKILADCTASDKVIFANGGDRTKENIPEMAVTDRRLEFAFGVGGSDKKNSSSWILREWTEPKTVRPWGYYRVLHDVTGCKVKELVVEPGSSLSMQKHRKRKEFWLVSKGACVVERMTANGYTMPPAEMSVHGARFIDVDEWHKLTNPYTEPCHIVEIQYGSECVEEDIQRFDK